MKNIFLYSFVSIVLYKLISTISAEMYTLQKAEKNATHESEYKNNECESTIIAL